MVFGSLNECWASVIVDELSRLGVTDICIAPGSRSSALTLAAAKHPEIETTVHIDERALSFFALGLAKVKQTPVAIITTSGSAVANLLPAVVEAYMDHVPLVLITADRPPELRGVGANQTIVQPKLFSHYVVCEYDLPCPTQEISLAYLLSTVDELVFRSRTRRRPVHVNLMFREPLIGSGEQSFESLFSSITSWMHGRAPFTRLHSSKRSLQASTLEHLSERLMRAKRGLIVAGKLDSTDDAAAVLQLAEQLQWPVVADILSHLVFSKHPLLINTARVWPNIDEALSPELILEFGGKLVSKTLLAHMCSSRAERIQIASSDDREDPSVSLTERVFLPVSVLCKEMKTRVKRSRKAGPILAVLPPSVPPSDVAQAFPDLIQTERMFCQQFSRLLHDQHLLYCANSLPIRHLNAIKEGHYSGPIQTLANRGASGIDGLLSSALGAAAGTNKTVCLMLGDLSCLYDINALMMAENCERPFKIILLNNHGGAIFSTLYMAESDYRERFFNTPQHVDFEKIVSGFGVSYTRLELKGDYMKTFRSYFLDEQTRFIEVRF